MKILKIGSFELPVYSSFDLSQRYEPIGGETILRTMSGRGIFQRAWRKTRVVTSGGGWVPAGLDAIDNRLSLALACVVPRTVPAVAVDPLTVEATLPLARRADDGHVPYGLAQMPGGQTIEVAVTMAGDVATMAVVPGAARYQVGYYPLLDCWVKRATESGPGYSWEFIAEEV